MRVIGGLFVAVVFAWTTAIGQNARGPLPGDPVTRLIDRIDKEETTLEYEPNGRGFLRSLLAHLDIQVDSQLLVFSKTSRQEALISPKTPRALYFNDGVFVGFVQGGHLELAVADPTQGVVFYDLDNSAAGKPRFEPRSGECASCHGPRPFASLQVKSVYPGPDGTPFIAFPTIAPVNTDHRSDFEKRWGGWYVTGTHGSLRHMGNAVTPDLTRPLELEVAGTQNVTSLAGKLDLTPYLAPTSDLVALMTFEHQVRMTNLIGTVGRQARAMAGDGGQTSTNSRRLDAAVEPLIVYMLFADEAPLLEPVKGVSTFTDTFAARGPRDPKGRSLRDFDLRARLFRYPLSYMVYSEVFDALPDVALERIYKRLFDVLSGRDTNPPFNRLSADDRRAVLEILVDTKSNVPSYFR